MSVALRNLITGLGGIVLLFVLAPVQSARAGRRCLRDRDRDAACSGAGCAPDRAQPARTGWPTSVAMVCEVLGAMKIVQGFNQEQRESARFGEAVEATFTTAKRRILLRAG